MHHSTARNGCSAGLPALLPRHQIFLAQLAPIFPTEVISLLQIVLPLVNCRVRRFTALALAILLIGTPAIAGVTITGTNGIVMTGADGVTFDRTNGIVMTGADSIFNYRANGIVMTGADGIVMTGADGWWYPDSVRTTSADGIVMTGADGIVMTGADGIVMTGADGTTYNATSVTITRGNGIVMTGADGIVMTGADGVQRTTSNGIVMTGADGIVMTGADGIVMTGADGIVMTGADGTISSVAPSGMRFAGVTGIVMTGADGIVMTGADGILMTDAYGAPVTAGNTAANGSQNGLQSLDPELALQLNQLTDDSSVNAVIVYYHMPTDADLAGLQQIGIVGGTRYHALPMITISATRNQIVAISHLSAVRSIYGNRTLNLTAEPEVSAATGVDRVRRDVEITNHNNGLSVSGRNVTVAVLDTGIDGTHGDLAGRVAQNVKLASTQSASVGFGYPVNAENLPNTDQLYGHGTFVAGLIGGNGAQSGGRYTGVASSAKLVGLSAGDLSLLYVLEGFDYLLTRGNDLGVRVVNCSFSAETVFDVNDPVNIATRMLTDHGINVVFSAGNTGPGLHTLNPYAVAPWVVSVGATDTPGHIASFSSRGDFASALFHPTLVAPGVNVVSLRGSGISNVTGAEGIAVGADTQRLSSSELPYYTTSSGTSFSAPQVAGAIALILEANPGLTPAQVKDILQRTATPLPPYYQHDVGAGMLNVHAAVLQADFPNRALGKWRGTLDHGQVQFINDPATTFTGVVQPGAASAAPLAIPGNALFASVQVSWGPFSSVNDLGLKVYDPSGSLNSQSNSVNLPGLTGKRERVAINTPVAGSWQASVVNTLGVGMGSQEYIGVLEISRAKYAPMSDLSGLDQSLRNDIYQSLRTYTMWPMGSRFHADFAVTRADLATALVLGGRVPQYLPGQPNFSDARDAATMPFVESAQAAPGGPLFINTPTRGSFRPYDSVDRLTAAVALVRAAGLRAQAESQSNAPLAVLDALSIPSSLRGYVSLAISKGFLTTGNSFYPQRPLNRGELAHAMAALQKLASQ
jgi:serine protease AprX